MRIGKPKWIIPKGNLETDEDIWIYEEDPEVLQLEARGLEQKAIANWLGMTEKCVKNHIENINNQTGVSSPKERMSWAFRVEILIVVERVICIGPLYVKKESIIREE
jgi:hypothetical protein